MINRDVSLVAYLRKENSSKKVDRSKSAGEGKSAGEEMEENGTKLRRSQSNAAIPCPHKVELSRRSSFILHYVLVFN